jgi:predicted patatin/cPLA2 family phospholipase
LFLGTSTGSLLISHLALGKVETIKEAFTQVNQSSIFSNNPFLVVNKNGVERIKINHFNVLKNFIRGRKTFGESFNLRSLIEQQLSIDDFHTLKQTNKEVVVCVANLTSNSVEYKKLSDCSYTDFLDWIWISCNFVPFMSLTTKEGCEYADGGLGCIIPIEKAISLGATHVDAILLDTEFQQTNRVHSRNPFDALSTIFSFISDRIEVQNIHIGKLVAEDYNASLRMFYTPRVLTTNSLVFNQNQMKAWWKEGFEYAGQKLKKG